MNLLDALNTVRSDIWDKSVRLVRHADARWDLGLLERAGLIEEYQARQDKPVFGDATHIVAFMGERGTRSRFLGVYRVVGMSMTVGPYPAEWPFADMPRGKVRYDLTRLEGFEELEHRLIIGWGSGTRSWVQRLRPKPVIEILPKGYVRDFPGYDEVLLRYDDLVKIISNPDANRVWHRMLGAVAGVYLVTDFESGDQYVGSAYGREGLLGRWTQYAKTRHGGNKRLKALLHAHPERYRAFSFSILRTLPRSMTDKEVIEVEALYKLKLGTRAFGLNDN